MHFYSFIAARIGNRVMNPETAESNKFKTFYLDETDFIWTSFSELFVFEKLDERLMRERVDVAVVGEEEKVNMCVCVCIFLCVCLCACICVCVFVSVKAIKAVWVH